MWRTTLALAAALLLLACAHDEQKAPAPGFGELSVAEVAAQVGKPGVYLFDNNTHERFDAGHLPTARWVDDDSYAATELPADKDATLIFYCHNEH
jgi:hypothetical protein